MKIAVVADDLTGANANGALLTAKGFPSATCLDPETWNPREFEGCAAVTFTADSRLLKPEEAREKFRRIVSMLAAHKPVIVSKRIDTTLRGNVGAEIEGALAALDASAEPGAEKAVAIVVPPFPNSGRIAAGGYLIVHGIPLERSPIAQDAATPVKSSSTRTVIAEQTDLPSGFISLATVLAGPEAVRGEALRLWREGSRIIVCDGVTNEDIAVVAQGVREMPFPVLAVDPGPFTAELAAARLAFPKAEGADRVLVIIGSTSELTRRQIETLRLARSTHIVRVDCEKLLDAGQRERAIDDAVAVLSRMREADIFGVCTAEKAEDVFSMETLSERFTLPPSEISLRINTALATIAERLLARPELRIGGLYTSGGEVTVTTIRTLGGTGFSVRNQVIPLAVYGHLLGGRHPGLPMVTKGGFVGDSEGLVQCLTFLVTKIGTTTENIG